MLIDDIDLYRFYRSQDESTQFYYNQIFSQDIIRFPIDAVPGLLKSDGLNITAWLIYRGRELLIEVYWYVGYKWYLPGTMEVREVENLQKQSSIPLGLFICPLICPRDLSTVGDLLEFAVAHTDFDKTVSIIGGPHLF